MISQIIRALKNMNTNIKTIAITSSLVVSSLLLSVGFVGAATFVQLTAQLDYGQTSNNVTNLQVFLASNPSIYPQGLVTGYFGPLTKSAVMNFQNAYGIEQVGRVGPATLAKINSLIASGVGLTGASGGNYSNNTIAPTIFYNSILINANNNSATLSWTTNEVTKGMVYYSTTPFQLREATGDFMRPTIAGGSFTQQTGSFQNGQSVTVSNLQSHTMYYYMIEANDMDGNFSYTIPQTFVTN